MIIKVESRFVLVNGDVCFINKYCINFILSCKLGGAFGGLNR